MERITAESLRESNKAFRLPHVPHIADRIEEMRKLADTGIEHAMVVDWHSGAVLWRTSGSDHDVNIEPAWKAGLSQHNLIIHTHPGPAECSIDDAACTTACEARANIAVCADGTTSIVGGIDIPAFLYKAAIECLATAARSAYAIDTDKCRANDPIEIARDNYAIAQFARDNAWVSHWSTHYSDALIAAMPTQGE